MFRVAAPSTSAAGVVEYFDKHLGKGDYYLDGSEHEQGLPGVWRGEGATMLGLVSPRCYAWGLTWPDSGMTIATIIRTVELRNRLCSSA